ncbi:ATP-dependent transcriptional regulator, MalT-like, LuxR family (plasmid) [Pseudarthrobacter chlorophenolicus A6]|uniref:ATP-dependent transcriptional regulator, MalT-like, LuxR family n=1 Tax=Pseudarthrobacter chlorophenolicus (strain ATCC 700700 / DSM 12829 / CIP 107037 / JCM 12360 / KCTC 9906 / NCIMB 13794 / A6) TaxID=452863 RepID=B8HI06_PSECP|nr:LuxR C-terminal-related transcriptional regulator [Pseudarthrobacter chlorophenolicus]ACL42053.1 ATP-dependent transcriptional regulator, MalT-like, LuxR family [Pseudarthrobacter chlorophenolicus A6]SDQ20905.1 LuxR family transcriptional regulator, maltose regulon positive regulatory protein [Pseudarthrobacter chlorophenolicus]
MMSSAEAPVSPVLGLPRVPRTVVSRPRLTELIADLLMHHDLVVVRAPAGAGKTVALAEWAASGATPGYISWISLDERYTDRTAFWREIILGTSLRVDEALRPRVIECADALMAGAEIRTVLRRFAPYIPETIVVIDRIELVHSQELLEDMVWVLKQCRQLKAVVASRGRSFLESPSVGRSLDTAVVGGAPFQLNLDETQDLLLMRKLPMDPTELHAATEGNPLLTRATMSVYGQSGAGSIRASVQTAVSDFLQASLAQSALGHTTKDFMVRTCIPESFTPALAERLTGSGKIVDLLDSLEDQGLGMWFQTGDHRRFEYTPAVRALLQKSLKCLDPRDIDSLTRIVIDDDLSMGNAINALRQAVIIGDLDLASRIACDHHITLLVSQAQAILGILEPVPLSRLRKHPALIMALALCHNATYAGRVKALEYFGSAVACAAIYKMSMDPGQRIWMLVLESTALRFAGKLEPALKLAKRSVEAFEESPYALKEQLAALEPTLYDQAAIAYLHDQQFSLAADLLAKALDASRRVRSMPSIYLTTGLLAYALGLAGKTTEARVHLAWLNSASWPPGMLDGYWATTYRLAQVREAMDRQSYTEAAGYLDLINDEMQVSEFWPHIVTFRVLLDLHRTEVITGPATLEARIRQAHKAPLNSSGHIDLDGLRAGLHLIAGQPQKAASALRHGRNDPRVLLMRARIALHLGDPSKTLQLTGFEGLEPRQETHRLLLRAAAFQRLDDPSAAKDNSHAAATLMAQNGLTMTGALMAQEDLDALFPYVQEEHPDVPVPRGVVPPRGETASLTPRELVVLNAFARHKAANDVAAALNVSVNTVKSQRRSILKKLAAHSMEEALTIARRQRLLED